MFFGLFASQEKKMRDNAGNWLELADKVYNYRRDVLPAAQVAELQGRSAELKAQLKERAGAEKLKLSIERLEEVLRRTGGAIYPKSALVENVEFFLVAALVILGIRTYFVQPFKIPTNSMWPTYNGMTPEVFTKAEEEPSAAAKVLRFAAFGAVAKRVDAPADGEVLLPVEGFGSGRLFLQSRVVPGRTWLVFPTQLKEYRLIVGRSEVTVQVPMDFDFEWAVRDAFFPNATSSKSGGAELLDIYNRQAGGQRPPYLRTGKQVKRGERLLSFDIITGDQLFVDRLSYHFVPPAVGSGFVFRTDNIPGIGVDQYYIKRLVGTPGDTLEIREPFLYRNGAPITGSVAFEKNGQRVERYAGYFHPPRQAGGNYLFPGEKVTIKKGEFFAMGDNSGNSQDSRYWGFVPGRDVVGRPLFVYYPFTKHWGPAR